MKRSFLLQLFCMVLLLVAVGCANPAADAPQAEVEEPAAAPAVEQAVQETIEYALEGSVEFVGSKVTGTHEGGFESFEGTVSAGETAEQSSVQVRIDATSVWSDNERLTGHLKSDDFFAVETFPTATFESTEIVANEEGGHTVTGNLTLHGVTKQISFPADILLTDEGFTAKAEFSIMRFDFDIAFPGKTDDLIRDEVLIRLDLRSAAAMDASALTEDDDSSQDDMQDDMEEGEAQDENEGS